MLDVRQAAAKAIDYFKGLYAAETIDRVLLEEVESSPDDQFWYITVGFDDKPGKSPLSVLAAPSRRYKLFKIDKSSGEVISMKIRQVDSSNAA